MAGEILGQMRARGHRLEVGREVVAAGKIHVPAGVGPDIDQGRQFIPLFVRQAEVEHGQGASVAQAGIVHRLHGLAQQREIPRVGGDDDDDVAG